ncbi:MAG: class I SAM-dependent methyltransferase [Calditrichaceae bacterium]|nr:class I SAM-dependent methyltransferase [Calditrichaceae bacterium]MBN2708230.1 class I SAM-dependent methyltransferase [Calditrichaceae bacterium]RQV92253.1 MAG: class I SAM-dependent methyltransferase [Calditrichota bacterium]
MPKIEPFEQNLDQYEDWFKENKYVYLSELDAVRPHIPETGNGIEIGVGSGLFAEPLGIRYGVEPSEKMRSMALKRGIDVIDGVAEKLPVKDESSDFALMVTTICFVDNPLKSITEARRIIKSNGKLIIGFVDKDSPVGKTYRKFQHESVFYRDAIFYSTEEIIGFMQEAGFKDFNYTQTIFNKLNEINKVEPYTQGYGNGSFVVISANKFG